MGGRPGAPPEPMPSASDKPSPSEPVEASSAGMKRTSGWPWYIEPSLRSVFS